MYLAQNLKYLREQKGLSQQELSSCFEISCSLIGMWEQNRRKPDIGTIVRLAQYFGVSLDDLVLKDLRPPVPKHAENIRYLRLKHGMNQEDIAKLLSVSKATACKYENGNVEPTVAQLLTLADFFGVSMDQIIKQDLSQEVVECSH